MRAYWRVKLRALRPCEFKDAKATYYLKVGDTIDLTMSLEAESKKALSEAVQRGTFQVVQDWAVFQKKDCWDYLREDVGGGTL